MQPRLHFTEEDQMAVADAVARGGYGQRRGLGAGARKAEPQASHEAPGVDLAGVRAKLAAPASTGSVVTKADRGGGRTEREGPDKRQGAAERDASKSGKMADPSVRCVRGDFSVPLM